MNFELLSSQNPWWGEKSTIEQDKHIIEFRNASIKWYPSIFDEFVFDEDLVYIIRGPRQIGKTTTIKLLIENLLKKKVDPRQIIYLDCELAGIKNFKEIIDILNSYIVFIRTILKANRLYMFIDEITFIKNWAIGIKSLSDKGVLKNITTIVTGSDAIDLKRGGERMPGRRGERAKLNKNILPLTFREYVLVFNPELISKIPAPFDPNYNNFEKIVFELSPRGEILSSLFNQYILTGGFPRPINSFVKAGKVEDFVYELYRDSIIGEVTRIGKRESYFREIVSWIIERHGDPFDWRDISRETDIGKHDTAREYAEDLELLFLWDILFRSQDLSKPSPAFRSQKKIYFKDPFIFQAFRSWSRGVSETWKTSIDYLMSPEKRGDIVESIITSHLRKKYGKDIFYWKPNHEVDFLIFREGKLHNIIEVKYQEKIRSEDIKHLKKLGKGILLSKSDLKTIEKNILIIPVHLFLAVL